MKYHLLKKNEFKKTLKLLNKEQKIEKLKSYADNFYAYKIRKPEDVRNYQDENKFKQFQEWKKCFVCKDDPVQVIHHIVMVSNGDTNDWENLIGICNNCHAKIHPWLN